MKIVDIQLDRLRLPLEPPFAAAWDPEPRRHFDATVVTVRTDEGLVGIGSGDTMDGFEPFIDLFIGQDPMNIAHHVKVLETLNFHSGRYWPMEVALWDIIGQACNQPVATLMGGSDTEILAYASTGQLMSPSARAEAVLSLREQGFRAVKIRLDRLNLSEGLRTVSAVRDAVGSTMEIMVDLNQAWRMPGDVASALDLPAVRRLTIALRDLDVFWIEEPLPAVDARGLLSLRHETGMRIAGGEMARTMAELLEYLDTDSLDVFQPDVVLAVGMYRARTIADLCYARNRWFTPHTWTNGLGLLANLHVCVGVGGGPYFEFPYDPPGWTPERRDFLLEEPVRVGADGKVRISSDPGLGAHLNLDAIAHYRIDAE
jgi:D-galactarolactone cycloisomerase